MVKKITPIAHILLSKENEILVKDSALEKWVKETFFSNTAPAHSTKLLSQFGLKNAKDVIAFLKSPGGKLMENELIAQEVGAVLLQEQKMKLLLEQLFMHLLRSLLFLSFIGKKSQAATHKNLELMVDQQQKLSKKSTAKSTRKADLGPELLEQLEKAVSEYEKAIDLLMDQQQASKAALGILDEELLKIHDDKKHTSNKYVLVERHFNELNHLDEPDLTESALKTKINEIRESLEQHLDDHSPIMIVQRFSKNLQIEALKERLAVKRAEKYYLNSELKPVTSFSEAAFVLNRMMYENNVYVERPEKIVKLGDEFYLLRPGQTEESLHENQDEKAEARNRFEHRKQDIMPMLKRIEHEKSKEFSLLNHREEIARTHLHQHQTFLAESDKHLNSLNLAMTAAMNARAAALSRDNTPRPTPAPTASPTPKPVPENKAFIQELEELLKRQNVSSGPVFQLIRDKALNKSILNDYLNQHLAKNMNQKQFDQKIAMNIPLTPPDKEALLNFIKQLATKDEKLTHLEPNSAPTPLSFNPLKTKPHG